MGSNSNNYIDIDRAWHNGAGEPYIIHNLVVAKINVKLKKQTQIKAQKERHKTNTERRVETNGRKRHKVKRVEKKKKI